MPPISAKDAGALANGGTCAEKADTMSVISDNSVDEAVGSSVVVGSAVESDACVVVVVVVVVVRIALQHLPPLGCEHIENLLPAMKHSLISGNVSVPVKSLKDKLRRTRDVCFAIDGTVPLNWLSSTRTNSNEPAVKMDGGSVPESWLAATENHLPELFHDTQGHGASVPLRLLWLAKNELNDGGNGVAKGSEPENWF